MLSAKKTATLRSAMSLKGPVSLGVLLFVLAATTPFTPPTGTRELSALASSEQIVVVPVEVIDDFPPKREPPPPPPKPVVADNSLRVGSSGPQVLALEQQLSDLHYVLGAVDGVFDSSTAHGVMAFQKVERLRRTGRADEATLARLATASVPAPLYITPSYHLEVDIPRQVVLVVRDGIVTHILPAVTGNGKKFFNPQTNRMATATTPNGRYKINRKIKGLRISPLGQLWWPNYFNGGIALHGSPSMPAFPASHGCVRLPMQFAEWFHRSIADMGTTVYVYGGPAGDNPQPYVADAPAPSPSPTPSPTPASPSPTSSPSESPIIPTGSPSPPEPTPS